jgi:hypothetical protein
MSNECTYPGSLVFRGNYWECAVCGSIACAKERLNDNSLKSNQWEKKTCECGGEKTYGKPTNLHASWCKLHTKY